MAADDGYAMPLAVAVRSLLDTLEPGESPALYVLDGGLSPENRDRCVASWDGMCASVQWIRPTAAAHAGLPTSPRFPIASYFRISIAELLPADIDRAIFVDPDVLFLRSPLALLGLDLEGCPIAAVQDAYCPFVNNRIAMGNFRRARRHVCGIPALPDLPPRSPIARQPYFNAGFLVMDLATFRRERIGRRLLKYCRDNHDRLLWADQCAFNACLGDRWSKLDDAWNVTPHVFTFPGHEVTHYDQPTFDRIRSRPYVVHFSGVHKPWHEGCGHPFVNAYWDVVARTAWRGSRPAPTPPRAIKARSARSIRPFVRRAWRLLTGGRMDAWDITGGTVATGPFRGMRYGHAAIGSVLSAKLLGTYERELHPWVHDLIGKDYRRIHVVGCAEGYYAVGLARSITGAMVLAYDLDPRAPAALADLAARNGVGDRVRFAGEFNPGSLSAPTAETDLIVCDVEGAELSLLDPTAHPQLLQCDLLVEIHDASTGSIEHVIEARFASTHRIRRVAAERRTCDTLPHRFRRWISDARAEELMNERRRRGLTWLLIERLGPGRPALEGHLRG
jgi:lipopolysaccharide biosynthesis glycosyltransferase